MSKNNYCDLLKPNDCTMLFIDHQPQMAFGVASKDRQLLLDNVVALAKTAKVFDVPTILTTVETESFSGYMWPQILKISSLVRSAKYQEDLLGEFPRRA